MLAACLLFGIPGVATAQDDGFDVQLFNPSPSQSTNNFGTSQARILNAGQWEVGLLLNYASNPLVVLNSEDDRLESIVSGQFVGNILGAVGIADRLELGLDVPLVFLQTGDELDFQPGAEASDASFGIGDVRIVPQLLILDRSDRPGQGGPALALAINTHLPTGDSSTYQGGDFRIEPRLIFDHATRRQLRFSVSGGFLVRPEVTIRNLDVGNSITYGAGVEVPLGQARRSQFIAELQGSVAIVGDEINEEETPMELRVGARRALTSGAMFQGGLGTGVIGGYGTPVCGYSLHREPEQRS